MRKRYNEPATLFRRTDGSGAPRNQTGVMLDDYLLGRVREQMESEMPGMKLGRLVAGILDYYVVRAKLGQDVSAPLRYAEAEASGKIVHIIPAPETRDWLSDQKGRGVPLRGVVYAALYEWLERSQA